MRPRGRWARRRGRHRGGGGAIIIVAPATSPTYTNGTITIQVSFDPATTAGTEVALFTGDTKLVDLTPPFSFVWDTTSVAEGSYSLTARARIGGRAVTSSPVTVVVDRTAPSVVLGSRVPAPGASEVSLAQPIQLAFSEPILPPSASGALTLAQASGAIATTATLAADGKALTVAIADRSKVVLSASAPITLTASVSPTVTDLAGNAVTAPPQWSWTVPLWLDYGNVRGESPSLALDATGEPLISTTFEPGAIGSRVYTLQVSRHLQGTSWDTSAGSPQTADTLTLYGSTSITVGTDGRPIVAWSEQPMGGPAASIHVARWSGSAWDSTYPPLDQVPGSKTDGYTPSLTLGSTNQPMVAWAEVGTNSVTDVYVARWTGSTWTQLPALGVIGASSPVLLAGGGGEPIVGWVASLGAAGVSTWTGAAWSTNNFPRLTGEPGAHQGPQAGRRLRGWLHRSRSIRRRQRRGVRARDLGQRPQEPTSRYRYARSRCRRLERLRRLGPRHQGGALDRDRVGHQLRLAERARGYRHGRQRAGRRG